MVPPLFRCLAISSALALLAACEPPEDYERARRDIPAGDYPAIMPLDDALAVAGTPELEPADAAALQARAAALQARAGALPDTATDAETRARLEAAIAGRSP